MVYDRPELKLLGFLHQRFRQTVHDFHDWRVERLESRIVHEGNIATPRLSVFSRQLGLSPDHLGRVFKRHLGSGFREFSLQRRMEHAAALLARTARSVKDIAIEAGYQHPSDFSRKFRSRFGVSPQEFRRDVRATGGEW
jgi:AraC-like DNA-binding protein